MVRRTNEHLVTAAGKRRLLVCGWLVLVASACYVSMFQGLESVGLIGPDEPRYAAVARAMEATGDWVTPRLNGEPWFEKPILYYWVAAAGYRVLGDGEAAARMPSALAALLTTLAAWWIMWRLFGATSAAIVVLIFPLSVAGLGFARAASTDMLFTGTLTMAMAAAAALLLRPEEPPSTALRAAFGAALGLAILAKGPAGVLLATGSLVAWASISGAWKRVGGLVSVPALAGFGLVGLPWYVLCTIRNPAFFDDFIVSHNVARFFTPVFRHEQPVWFFVPVLALGIAPWTPIAVEAVRHAVATKTPGWRASPVIFFACWALFPVLFFSASRSKLPGYILPAVPALMIVLAATLGDSLERQDRTARRSLALVGLLVVAAAAAVQFSGGGAASGPSVPADLLAPLSAGLFVGGAIVVLLSVVGRPRSAFAVTAIVMVALTWQLNSAVVPRLDEELSARSAARRILALRGVGGAEQYRLHRAWRFGLDYYLGRELPEWSPDSSNPPLLVTSPVAVAELRSGGFAVDVVDALGDEVAIVRLGGSK